MKNLIGLIFICCLLAGCKAWDISKITVKKDPISPRLLTLDKKMEDIENVTVFANNNRERVFTKEVEENLIDPYGDKYGHIIMKQNIVKYHPGYVWFFINVFTLCTPMLVGCPIAHDKYLLEVELRITDSKNKLIGKYSAIGKGSATAAMYYGYSIENSENKSYVDALNDAFNQIRPQIQKDVSIINEKLRSAGKL